MVVIRAFFGLLIGGAIGFGLFMIPALGQLLALVPAAPIVVPLVTALLGGKILSSWESETKEAVHGSPIKMIFLWLLAVIVLLAGLFFLGIGRG